MDAATTNGCSPLYIAANNGCAQAAALLLEAGADPDLETTSGCTALHAGGQWAGGAVRGEGAGLWSCFQSGAWHTSKPFGLGGHPPALAKFNLRHNLYLPPLRPPAAALNGHAAVVRELVAAACDLDAQSQNGSSALHNAASGAPRLLQ